jgi:phosphatidylinositol glycan class N
MIIFLALGPLFIILTISYEGLFYFAIAITLFSWVQLEHRIHQRSKDGSTCSIMSSDDSRPPGNARNAAANDYAFNTKKTLKEEISTPLATAAAEAAKQREKTAAAEGNYRSLILSDVRVCLFFLFLLHSAFFSTGNIASVSSFSLDAVYRLLPIFDPFSQAALLIFKILSPFALVSANLGFLTKRLKLQGGSLFTVVMGIGDYMTLRFFWAVRDEGSWLEIGESISIFIIASALCVFLAGLEALSVFVRGVEFQEEMWGKGNPLAIMKDS